MTILSDRTPLLLLIPKNPYINKKTIAGPFVFVFPVSEVAAKKR